jgi:hypothetical protein
LLHTAFNVLPRFITRKKELKLRAAIIYACLFRRRAYLGAA